MTVNRRCHHDTPGSRLAAGAWRVAGTTLALLLVSWLAACTETRDGPITPESPVDPACLGCHGDSTTPAPRDAAHRVHLDGTTLFAPVACEECHVVPTTPSQPGHADSELPADVIFGGGAVPADGPAPTWDPEQGTCAGVACHGADLDSAPSVERDWRSGAMNLGDCGACHGDPPGGTHPPSASPPEGCVTCHGPLTMATHGDGNVFTQLPTDCSACHGDADSPAPTDLIHRAHVLEGGAAAAVACESCHPVPEETASEGHLDAGPAEVVFGGLALHDGAAPTYADGTCSNTYCHASGGGAVAAPSWMDTSGQATACTACHDDPPAFPHPQLSDCLTCHGEVLATDHTIGTPARHVDGTVDEAMPTDCGACHGTSDDPSPLDAGHITHRSGVTVTTKVECEACHVVPYDVLVEGHIDTLAPAEVTFGGLAVAGGAAPTWDAQSCASTYCHGGDADPLDPPVWGDTSGTWAACDACHGAPPAVDHPLSDRCDVCHADVAAPDLAIGDLEQHVDGQLQWAEAACDSCHGAGGTNAPDTGAHLAHLDAAVSCDQCHAVPAAAADPGHLDTLAPAELTFGDIAKAGSSSPFWSTDTATCSNVWCHDAASGAALDEPAWADTSGAPGECGACHGAPPDSAVHDQDWITPETCATCHSSYPDGHIDGVVGF